MKFNEMSHFRIKINQLEFNHFINIQQTLRCYNSGLQGGPFDYVIGIRVELEIITKLFQQIVSFTSSNYWHTEGGRQSKQWNQLPIDGCIYYI